MPIRGIRGATTVSADEPDLILQATRELLEEILAENEGMRPEGSPLGGQGGCAPLVRANRSFPPPEILCLFPACPDKEESP